MNRGIASTWHKWDFHVHTPYSILNNGYGVDPFTTESEASFDQYIQSLFLKILSRGNVRLNFYLFSFLYSFKGNRRHSYREAAVITSIILALPPGHSSVL